MQDAVADNLNSLAEMLALRQEALVARANFGTDPIASYHKMAQDVIAKRIVPYQLEVHPGRLAGKKICWMECPYCYGVSATNSEKRLSKQRFVDLIRQTARGPNGKIPRLMYTGHATDPLYCEYIDALIEQTVSNQQVFGIYSKLLNISDDLVALLVSARVMDTSFINVSIDAGYSSSYNQVHGLSSRADVLSKVLKNIKRLSSARKIDSRLDICTTYLVTEHNNSEDEVKRAIDNITQAGADTLRFNFAQVPRAYTGEDDRILPARAHESHIFERIKTIVDERGSDTCRVTIMAREEGREESEFQVTPCVARFLTPTIGFDGYLYHCSESAAPDFHASALGNLENVDFWDAYYGYSTNDLASELQAGYAKMKDLACHCNRECYRNNKNFASDSSALEVMNLS